ncbi:unnamed protein product [Parnassius apollo]|uniref:(apollo) hypothetical protein n=1 Tax=Parnassius apollo TaxID=110799 RepID=A0A8S3W5N0_PARAO|nr:unnamed protein product [Parnassius apollo]
MTECGGTSSSLSRSAGVSVNLQTSDESAKPPETSIDTVESSCSSAVVVVPTTKSTTPNTSASTPAFENVYQYSKRGAKYDRITDAIAYFIAVDNRPFYAVERKDIWTETLTNTGYLGLTVHILQQNVLQSMAIGVFELEESHTGEYIGQQLTGILRSWNIDTEKVMAFVTDSGANMIKAIRETFGAHKHIPYFAHMINKVSEEAIRKTSGLNDIIEHVKIIVKYIKKRQDMALELKRKEIENKIPDGKTLK